MRNEKFTEAGRSKKKLVEEECTSVSRRGIAKKETIPIEREKMEQEQNKIGTEQNLWKKCHERNEETTIWKGRAKEQNKCGMEEDEQKNYEKFIKK